MFKVEKYLNIPYLYNGRDFKGCDCWGLAYLFYQQELDIELIDYKNSLDDSSISNYIIENMHTEFVRTEQQVPGDVVLFCDKGSQVPNHIGIVLDNYSFLHIVNDQTCHMGKFRVWQNRIYGFYSCKPKEEYLINEEKYAD